MNKESESELTLWEKVDRTLGEAKIHLKNASTEEQYQAIGVFCRETLITLAQIVYDPSKHLTEDNVRPSKTDAKRMLSAYFSHELAGSSNEAVRRQAKATLDVANSLQHKRTAKYKDAALCVEATTTVVNTVSLVSGHTRKNTTDIEVEFLHKGITIDYDENLYLLRVLVTNTGTIAIKEFKLVFSFPNLDIVPRKWILLGDQNKSNKKLVQITPKGNSIEVQESGYLVQITYRSKDTLFPQDKLDLSESIGLRFIINQSIYSNIEDIPPLSWTLYADNLHPQQGEILLTRLNHY